MPEAQQVMTGLSFFIVESWLPRAGSGMFSAPLIWPL
jgi:hypothetical protein